MFPFEHFLILLKRESEHCCLSGYLNNPEATQMIIVEDSWLRTGDIAYFDEDGYLFIVDRIKEIIKYKGFQVRKQFSQNRKC